MCFLGIKDLKKILYLVFAVFTVCTVVSCKTADFYTPEYGVSKHSEKNVIKKVYNFRAVESLVNIEGRTLKKGMLYRSGHLHQLKRKSFKKLENLGIKEIIDLRNSGEITQKPDRLPQNVLYKNFSAFEDKGDQLDQARKLVLKGKVKEAEAEERMLSFYRNYPLENTEIIKEIIHEILDSENPVLYHCTAGKDRTGIITALILKILNFDDDEIYNNYLLSNNYRESMINKRLRLAKNLHFLFPKMDLKVLEKLSWVEKPYLDAMFREVEKKYGSVDLYIENVLEIGEIQRHLYQNKFLN